MKLRIPVLIPALLMTGTLMCAAVGAHAAQVDACKLIPAAAAAKILGAKVTVKDLGAPAGPGGASLCMYKTDHGGGFMLRVARVHYSDAKQEMSDIKIGATSPVAKTSFKNVKGLGDAALLAKTSGYLQLHVLDRGTHVMVQILGPVTAANVARAEKLARAALAHLK